VRRFAASVRPITDHLENLTPEGLYLWGMRCTGAISSIGAVINPPQISPR
jgi:hypothetical protein